MTELQQTIISIVILLTGINHIYLMIRIRRLEDNERTNNMNRWWLK